MKLLVTFGRDFFIDENQDITDQAYVIKIWDFQSLIAQSYNIDGGLTGGTIWSKSRQVEQAQHDPTASMAPRLIPILINGKPYLD